MSQNAVTLNMISVAAGRLGRRRRPLGPRTGAQGKMGLADGWRNLSVTEERRSAGRGLSEALARANDIASQAGLAQAFEDRHDLASQARTRAKRCGFRPSNAIARLALARGVAAREGLRRRRRSIRSSTGANAAKGITVLGTWGDARDRRDDAWAFQAFAAANQVSLQFHAHFGSTPASGFIIREHPADAGDRGCFDVTRMDGRMARCARCAPFLVVPALRDHAVHQILSSHSGVVCPTWRRANTSAMRWRCHH